LGATLTDVEGTFARLLLDRADDDHAALLFEDQRYSWVDVVRAARARAGLIHRYLGAGSPPHIGVLLENVPEYIFWIGAAALAGATVVGINPTRRGAELAADIRHTDCRMIVTDSAQAPLLDGLDTGVPPENVLLVDRPTPLTRGVSRTGDPSGCGKRHESTVMAWRYASVICWSRGIQVSDRGRWSTLPTASMAAEISASSGGTIWAPSCQ
jgi:acyl-CoA synthetase (AMP-forming)/AMP-acid ligase II